MVYFGSQNPHSFASVQDIFRKINEGAFRYRRFDKGLGLINIPVTNWALKKLPTSFHLIYISPKPSSSGARLVVLRPRAISIHGAEELGNNIMLMLAVLSYLHGVSGAPRQLPVFSFSCPQNLPQDMLRGFAENRMERGYMTLPTAE